MNLQQLEQVHKQERKQHATLFQPNATFTQRLGMASRLYTGAVYALASLCQAGQWDERDEERIAGLIGEAARNFEMVSGDGHVSAIEAEFGKC